MSALTITTSARNDVTRHIGTALKHTFVYGFGGILAKVVAFALLPFYSHYLTPRDYGIVELLDLAMSVLGMFLSMGITAAFLRYYSAADSDEQKRRILGSTFLFAAGAGTIIFLGGLLLMGRATLLLFGSGVPPSYFLMSFSLFVLAYVATIPYTYLRAKEASVKLTTLDCAGVLAMLALNIYFIAGLHMSVFGVLLSQLMVGFGKFVFLIVWMRGAIRLWFDWSILRKMLTFGVPLIASNLTMFVLNFSDRFFLQRLQSLDQVGIYAMGYKFGFMLNFLLIQPFNMMWQARMYLVQREGNARGIFTQVFVLYSLTLIFASLGLALFSPEVIRWMVDAKYAAAAGIVAPVALSYVLLGFGYYFQSGMLLTSRTGLMGFVNGLAAIWNLALNYLLIDHFGMSGAAWATVLGFLAIATGNYWCSQRVLPMQFGLRRVLLALAVAAGLYLAPAALLAGASPVVVILAKVILLGLFPVALWALRLLSDDEIHTLRALGDKALNLVARRPVLANEA
jgi:O-antigen/teichoic acid export membrane protein